MNSLNVTFNQTEFLAGKEISGDLSWHLAEEPSRLSVSLLWYTKGRGTQDVSIIETINIDSSGANGNRPFTFMLPKMPLSYEGKLFSIKWAIEAVSINPDEIKRIEFVLKNVTSE